MSALVDELPLEGDDEASNSLARADVALQLWSLLIDRVTAEITTEFEACGIPSILLKGPAFAELFYEDARERPYTDSDLLIPEPERERAERTLAKCGFVRVDRDEDWLWPAPKWAHTFERPGDGAVIDLHWTLSGASAAPQRVWEILSYHTATMELAGRQVTVLNPAASAVLVALHNAHHGTSRPRTLTDLDLAVEKLELADWVQARKIAADLGALADFAAGMRLTQAGDALADRLVLESRASVEMWLKTNPSSYAAWALDCFAQTPTLGGRLRLSAHVIFPPVTVMRTFSALSRRGRGGLALAYAIRPLRLLVHSPLALREWMRAWRATRKTSATRRIGV